MSIDRDAPRRPFRKLEMALLNIEPQRVRGNGFAPTTYPLVGWATFVVLVLAWHFVASARGDFIVLPTPGEVLSATLQMWRTGELMDHTTASLLRLLAGWSIGASAGVLLGFGIALSPIVRSSALPVVTVLFAMPKIALLPIFIVWLGIGEASKIATIAIGVFSPMAVATYSGVDAVDRNLIRMAQSFDVATSGIIRKVLFPGALPALLTGVRLSASISIVLLVGAEMIAAQYGLGALALNSGGLMRTDRLFAAVALLGACGLTVSWAIGLAERRLLCWR